MDDRIYLEGKVHEAGDTGNGADQKCTRCGKTLAARDPSGEGAADPLPPGSLVLEHGEETAPGVVSTWMEPVDAQEAERYRRCDEVR